MGKFLMPKFVGNTKNLIDWNNIVELCEKRTDGDHNTVTSVVDRSEAKSEGTLLSNYRSIMENWRNAGYEFEKIEWYDYYPGHHFSIDVENIISDIVNCVPRRVFVSKVNPGKIVPWHWDVEDKEDEWLSKGKLLRYVVFMQPPEIGHMLPVENHCFYNMPQGDVWEWDYYRNWHAGINLGKTPHYLFHFLGSPR
jgi:hypothetical protein